MRVALYTQLLCQSLNKSNNQALLLSAMLHDTQRLTDKHDPSHGKRAGVWFLTNYKNLFQDFDKKQIEIIYNIITYHDCKISELPKTLPDEIKESLMLFKYADAMDRYRLPKSKWWPDTQKLHLSLPQKFFHIAQRLIILSEQQYLLKNNESSIAVCNAAKMLGLLV